MRKLREGDRMLNEGTDLTEVLAQLEASESYGAVGGPSAAMKADEAKRLREFERENARLKKPSAEQALDLDMLLDALETNRRKQGAGGGKRPAPCRRKRTPARRR